MSRVVKEALCEELGETITIEEGEDGNWRCVNGCELHLGRKEGNLKRVVVGGVVERGQSGVAGCHEESETGQEEKLLFGGDKLT